MSLSTSTNATIAPNVVAHMNGDGMRMDVNKESDHKIDRFFVCCSSSLFYVISQNSIGKE